MVRPALVLLRWRIQVQAGIERFIEHPASLWHWSTTWPWFAGLFMGGLTIVTFNEAALGLVFVGLSMFSLCANLWHSKASVMLRILGTIGIFLLVVLSVMSAVAYVDDKPWSNLQIFWKRFVALDRIPASKMTKPMTDVKIDFPPTTFPKLPAPPSAPPLDPAEIIDNISDDNLRGRAKEYTRVMNQKWSLHFDRQGDMLVWETNARNNHQTAREKKIESDIQKELKTFRTDNLKLLHDAIVIKTAMYKRFGPGDMDSQFLNQIIAKFADSNSGKVF